MTDEEMDAPPHAVLDEEGDVDKALKRSIIQGRERVDETELALWRDAEFEPNLNLSEADRIHIYATSVKQFLRKIEPLLRSDEIPDADHYYTEMDLAQVTLVPPDTDGYQFSRVIGSDVPDDQKRQLLGMTPGTELPEPVYIAISGLKELIEREPILVHQWEVTVDNTGPPPSHTTVYPVAQQPVPKDAYTNAMRAAMQFLHEAGIGLETDIKGAEIIKDLDMSGEEPQSTYAVGSYEANPDI